MKDLWWEERSSQASRNQKSIEDWCERHSGPIRRYWKRRLKVRAGDEACSAIGGDMMVLDLYSYSYSTDQ